MSLVRAKWVSSAKCQSATDPDSSDLSDGDEPVESGESGTTVTDDNERSDGDERKEDRTSASSSHPLPPVLPCSLYLRIILETPTQPHSPQDSSQNNRMRPAIIV